MSLRVYAFITATMAALGLTLSDGRDEAPGQLGDKCRTPHHLACDDGLVCLRHRCALPCAAEPGSDCSTPAPAR